MQSYSLYCEYGPEGDKEVFAVQVVDGPHVGWIKPIAVITVTYQTRMDNYRVSIGGKRRGALYFEEKEQAIAEAILMGHGIASIIS